MEYSFIETSNPAYRYFTIKYFTEHGIEGVDEQMDREKVRDICVAIRNKDEIGEPETIFLNDVAREGADPQMELASLFTLSAIYDDTSVGLMKRLESELPERARTKFVLTRQDAALKFFDYYNSTFRMRLEEGIEDTDFLRLVEYIISRSEIDRSPEQYVTDVTKGSREAARAFVRKLQLWINEITPRGVVEDIDRVLHEHETAHNMSWSPGYRDRNSEVNDDVSSTCSHQSRYVDLEARPRDIEELPMLLLPARELPHDWRYRGTGIKVPFFLVLKTGDVSV